MYIEYIYTMNFPNPYDVNNNKFDILSYLNDLYMAKITPTLNITNAGGYHNIHNDNKNNKTKEEEILKNNKKRINIPNAEIKHFSVGSEENIEEYNESNDDTSSTTSEQQGGTGNNEVSNETSEKGHPGGYLAEKVIKISDENTKTINI